MATSSMAHSPHGGNRKTPLQRPCDRLLDIQANRQELQRDLAHVEGLTDLTCYFLEMLGHLYALAALIERPAQARLEAERARMEGR